MLSRSFGKEQSGVKSASVRGTSTVKGGGRVERSSVRSGAKSSASCRYMLASKFWVLPDMLMEGAVAGGDGVEVNNVTIGMRKFEVL